METDVLCEKSTSSINSRYRSPTFSREETKALITLIEKYKHIVLNTSTCSSAVRVKDATWLKIAKMFNKQGFNNKRSAESLKMKWFNLKRHANKMSKNLMNVKYSEFDDVTGPMIAMLCDADNNTTIVEDAVQSEDDISDTDNHKEPVNSASWNGNEERDSDESSIDGETRKRSLYFSPDECSLLLQCVRQEKSIVFSHTHTSEINKLKNEAWERICNSYNKLSPQKRSTKVLRTKFNNMKRGAKNIGLKNYLKRYSNKHQKLEEESCQEIKSEPLFEYRSSIDLDDNEDEADHIMEPDQNSHGDDNTTSDPLSTVLNSDIGLSSINQIEDKEVVKLKLELLKYKLETAKLKRKRLEDLMQADATERENKARESALRLRAARLETVAAEMKLPPSHPALTYTAEESRAQHYIHQYHTELRG